MTENQLKNIIKACAKTLFNEGIFGLTRKDLDEIINLRYIYGIPTLDKLEASKKKRLEIYNFIFRKMRWILDFQVPPQDEGSEWRSPFTHFFQSDGEGYEDWLNNFYQEVVEQLSTFKHWMDHMKLHKLTPNDPPHWLSRCGVVNQIAKRYPTFERDLTNLLSYIDTIKWKNPENPLDPENYPLYVSLYTKSREYGGPEEGGWYYSRFHYKTSIEVKNYKEARAAALKLLRDVSQYQAWEGTTILLEKNPKVAETRERPEYG